MRSYPSKHSDYNLKMMLKLNKQFNLHVGLSDHSEGDTVALAATALGASNRKTCKIKEIIKVMIQVFHGYRRIKKFL